MLQSPRQTSTVPGRKSRVRRAFLWASVVACLALAVLSIITSFFGAARTRAVFNSAAGVAVWWSLAALLALGLVLLPSLRRPGLLAAHLGPVLIVIGAAWGSPVAHRLRNAMTGQVKPASGLLTIYEGRAANDVWNRTGTKSLATLDFDVALEKFWIEYYRTGTDEPWGFSVEAIAPEQRGPTRRWRRVRVPWRPGQDTALALPWCSVSMRVIDYYLVQWGKGADAPIVPAAKVTFRRGDRQLEKQLEPRPGAPYVRVPLAGLYDSARAWHSAGAPVLFFEPPSLRIKDYKSTLVVRRDGKEVARKTVEVNDPLHYGGYHFYQYDYDHTAGEYTMLAVTSDAGLRWVYAGFVLLCGGILWHALPLKRLRRGRVRDG